MANITSPDKSTGDRHFATEYQEFKDWMNNPSKAQGTWDASVDIDMNESGVYSAHTATGDETWNFANLVEGNVKWLPLTTDGTHTFTIGTNGAIYVGSVGQLASGTYLIGLGVIAGVVRISVPQSTSQTQLDTPTNFQASASSQQVALSWSSPQGATSYTLEFSTNQTDWTDCTTLGTPYDGTSTNYTHTGLTNDTIYYYRVKARASAYTDSAYAQVNATPTATTIQLDAITLDTLTAGNTQVTLNFTNPNGGNEDDNLVQYSTDNFSSNIVNGVVLASAAISGIQTGLTNSTLYYFRIIARGSGSYSNANSSNILSASPSVFAPTDLGSDLVFFGDDSRQSANVVQDGTNISEWIDQSTSETNFIQNTGANKPLWDATNGIQIDTSSKYMSRSISAISGINFEVFMIIKPVTYVGNHIWLDYSPDSFNNFIRPVAPFTNLSIEHKLTTGQITLTSLGDKSGTHIFISARVDGASSSLELDGSSNTGTQNTLTLSTARIGSFLSNFSAIHNIIAFAITKELTTLQRQNMQAWFTTLKDSL